MARKTTQAATSGNTSVSKLIHSAALSAEADNETAKRFSVEVREKAFGAALEAISGVQKGEKDVRDLQTQISLKKEGNGSKLHKLAQECVRLTMPDAKTVDLGAAADLMQLACGFAENQTMHAYAEANPGNVAKNIRNVVPSWPVLKANVLSAMRKAKINPMDYPQPSGVRTAYEEWKKNNPEQVDNRGARPGGNNAGAEANKDGGPRAASFVSGSGAVEHFTASARSAIATLVASVQSLGTPDLQNAAAELIAACVMEINALKGDTAEEEVSEQRNDDAPQTDTRPMPPRAGGEVIQNAA